MIAETEEYVPLKGEGEVQYIKRTRVRRECNECGEPADYRHTFLLDGARRNPASSAYGKDDCSWCSDAETWSCAPHRDTRNAPDGYGWCGTFTLAKMPHLGLYYRDEAIEAPSTTADAGVVG